MSPFTNQDRQRGITHQIQGFGLKFKFRTYLSDMDLERVVDKQSLSQTKKTDRSHSHRSDHQQGSHIAPLETLAIMGTISETASKIAKGKTHSNIRSIQQEVKEAQLEFTQAHKSNSVQTIFAIVNSMVGTVCLVVPQSFLATGVLSGLIVMIIIGLIEYKTAQLIIQHQKPDEVDVDQMVTRILGKKWTIAFRLSSGSLMFLVGIIYFILINTTLYPVLEAIFERVGFTNYAPPSERVYDKFSIQYLALIIFIPAAIPQFLKNIGFLLKLAEIGVVAIFTYGFFVIYIFLKNITSSEFGVYEKDIVWFSWDIVTPAGQFSLAFLIHNFLGNFSHCNKNQSNNQRDLGIAYLLGGTIYGVLGVFGAIGIAGRKAIKPSTILDFFAPSDISVLIIETLYLIHLFSAFPIFNFISRNQIMQSFYPEGDYPPFIYYGYTVFYLFCCLGFQLFDFNPGKFIGFTGAISGFVIVYVIPLALHFGCYYPSSALKVSEVEQKSGLPSINEALVNGRTVVTDVDATTCMDHPAKNRVTKSARLIFYGLILSVGIFNLGISLKDLFGL